MPLCTPLYLNQALSTLAEPKHIASVLLAPSTGGRALSLSFCINGDHKAGIARILSQEHPSALGEGIHQEPPEASRGGHKTNALESSLHPERR